MAPETDPGFEERVERLAQKLLQGGDGNSEAAPDIESARRAARQMIIESEERTLEALDPEDQDLIRRTSSETAATGETGHRHVSDGE